MFSAFPGVFRGAFDVRASDIDEEEMKMAAAGALAALITRLEETLGRTYIIPRGVWPPGRPRGGQSRERSRRPARTGVARL